MASAPVARSDAAPFEGPPPPASLRPRFARTMDYLEALPDGIHSYPHCQARAGILQTFVEAMPAPVPPVDPWVTALLRPSPRAYVPEVVLQASLFAMGDAAGLNDAQFLEWNRATNRRLYGGLLYRALMAIFSPMQLLERAPKRWENFHQGTTLTVRSTGSHEATATLVFPERLFTRLSLRVYAGAFAAALEHARARDVTVELGTTGTASAEFVARWR
ncbi:MAG TPA: DUF2378 family protein [Anaeromyxobacter sp.]|nr:DUF2378 family protein [Anaeromyxobacter sp.]